MSGADLILYRRMRGIFDGLLIVGVVLVPAIFALGMTIAAQLGWFSDELTREVGRPAEVFKGGFAISGVIASIGAVIIGATAGSVDLQRGVLRDLVLAGRSRTRIVLGRLAGGATWLLPALAVAYAIIVVIGLTLAPIDESPDWEHVARGAAQYFMGVAYTLPFAAGIAMLVGSRGPAIAVYFAVTFIVDGVLTAIPEVGDLWAHVSLMRADQQVVQALLEEPLPYEQSVLASALVLAGWATIPFAAGLVRLSRRDL